MRIGIVSQTFAPIRGGVAQAVYEEAVHLQHFGHTVTVVTANFSRFDENKGLHVIRIGRDVTIPMNGAFVNLTIGLRLRSQLRAIEAERKFDIIHIHSPIDPILPMLATATLQAPKIGTFHSYVDGKSLGLELVGHKLKPIWFRLAGRVAVSEAAREFSQRYFPGEYRIIPNGVDTARFRPDLPRVASMDPAHFNILFVGRLDPRKGLRYLLEAFPSIHQRIPHARVTVVGDGMLRHWYKRMVPSALKQFVHFEGFVSAADLPRYYATADLYCSPATRGESFGIVLLEAMACGRPIVASSIRGYRTVLEDGKEAVLVPKRNATALADAVVRLATDPERRKRMGEAGLVKAQTYAWPVVTKALEDYFLEVLAQPQK